MNDAVKMPAPDSSRWIVLSLEGKTPAQAKSQAVAAARVQVKPAPASPPLVATITPEGAVVLHHGDAQVEAQIKPDVKPE
ncbi:MAG: hypothetical protein AAGA23_03465 [Pseudomonadota bacterium]